MDARCAGRLLGSLFVLVIYEDVIQMIPLLCFGCVSATQCRQQQNVFQAGFGYSSGNVCQMLGGNFYWQEKDCRYLLCEGLFSLLFVCVPDRDRTASGIQNVMICHMKVILLPLSDLVTRFLIQTSPFNQKLQNETVCSRLKTTPR